MKDIGKFKEAQFKKKKAIDLSFIQTINSRYKNQCIENIKLSKSQFRQYIFALRELEFKNNDFLTSSN